MADDEEGLSPDGTIMAQVPALDLAQIGAPTPPPIPRNAIEPTGRRQTERKPPRVSRWRNTGHQVQTARAAVAADTMKDMDFIRAVKTRLEVIASTN